MKANKALKVDTGGNPLNLQALLDFKLAASHGSYAKASRESGRPKATLSRHVIELENDLGTRLFERDLRRLRLTEEGESLNSRIDSLLADAESIREEVGNAVDRPRGRLKVCAPLLFSHLWLGKLATAFTLKYPEVTIEASMVDRPVDVVEEGFDVLITTNPPTHSDLVGRCFLRDHMVIAAPREIHKRVTGSLGETPPVVDVIVRTNAPKQTTWTGNIDGQTIRFGTKVVLRLPSMLIICEAVRAGMGVAELPQSLIVPDLEAGRLVSWGPTPESEVQLWVLRSSHRLVSRKVLVFMQFLSAAFSGDYQKFRSTN
jgi:DNA-binding transcriptional LysR family regulator